MVVIRTLVVVLLASITLSSSEYVDLGLKQSFKVNQFTSVLDGNNNLVGKRQVNLIVWGDFNKTTDKAAISSFVHDKVKLAESQPPEMLLDLDQGVENLPLQLNMTVTEMVQVGPHPQKNLALWLSVLLYGHKRHHQDLVDTFSAITPDF